MYNQHIYLIFFVVFEIHLCSSLAVTRANINQLNKTSRNIDFDEASTEDATYFMEEKLTDYVDGFDTNDLIDTDRTTVIITPITTTTTTTTTITTTRSVSLPPLTTRKEYRTRKFTTLPVENISYKRICVYPNWSVLRESVLARIYPEDIDPFLCTHIHYAYANIDIRTFELMPSQYEDNHNGSFGLVILFRQLTL
jgi:hypothetical protein